MHYAAQKSSIWEELSLKEIYLTVCTKMARKVTIWKLIQIRRNSVSITLLLNKTSLPYIFHKLVYLLR